jgi:two-component system OmpR family response regulator
MPKASATLAMSSTTISFLRPPDARVFIVFLLPVSNDNRSVRIEAGKSGESWEGRRRGGEELWQKYDFRPASGQEWALRVYSLRMARRIAIVEDEAAIRANYAEALARQGYEVAAYAARPEALAAFRTRLPDLAVIDIGLGDEPEGGFELCRELRALSPRLPIIFLSARDSDFDIVSGLRLGADDYLTKDISLPHLLARIAALFRRVDVLGEPAAAEEVLERGPLKLDAKRLVATWNAVPVELTLTEFWMVHTLAKFPGHVKDRDQLMHDAKLVVDEGTITSHIKRIRRKFQAVDPKFDRIDTVYGMGYRWKA